MEYLYKMKLSITEDQLKFLVTKLTENQEVTEDDVSAPAAEPSAGTSSTQSGGAGYPQVNKWESGVTRGPSNQIGVTKWSDVVGSVLKRSKGNQLK